MLEKSKWISYKTGIKPKPDALKGNPSPYFRRTFNAKIQGLKSAVLSITALGLFKAYINGQELENDRLLPGWTDYNKRIPVIKFDVTSKILENNAIGVVLGDGWYCGYIFLSNKNCIYGDFPELIAELELTYNDHKEIIVTDEMWRAKDGQIQTNSFYLGETIDMRCSVGDFSLYDYDDKNWLLPDVRLNTLSGIMQPAIAENTRIVEYLTPKLIIKNPNADIYDFGQNFGGIVTATICGFEGAVTTFRHAEMLDQNELYTENLRNAASTDTFISGGSACQTFAPLFTYHGFRYIEVSRTQGVRVENIKGCVIHNDMQRTGFLQTSNDILNKVYSNAFWSQKSNFISVPTDCPQRDERLGWTGDSQIFCGTAMFNEDCRGFFKKHLADIRDAQAENGSITIIAPIMDFPGFEGRAGWGDVITVLPYEYYLHYGDKQVITDNINAAKRWVQFCLNTSKNYIRATDGEGYGDWLSLDGGTDISLVSTAYFARSAYLTARMCEYLDDQQGMLYHDNLFLQIKKAYQKEFIAPKEENYSLKSNTQTAALLTYMFGLIDGQHMHYHLVQTVKSSNIHPLCGFIGVKYILPALCEQGQKTLAYDMITKTSFPSWGYSVVNGATTMWERWDSYTINKGFTDSGMNSFNHYAFGSCVEWMYKYMLGILPDTSIDGIGFKKVVIRPYIDTSGKVTCAQGSYETVNGKISVKWEIKEGTNAILKVDIPKNIIATFSLSDYIVVERKKMNTTYTFKLICPK